MRMKKGTILSEIKKTTTIKECDNDLMLVNAEDDILIQFRYINEKTAEEEGMKEGYHLCELTGVICVSESLYKPFVTKDKTEASNYARLLFTKFIHNHLTKTMNENSLKELV